MHAGFDLVLVIWCLVRTHRQLTPRRRVFAMLATTQARHLAVRPPEPAGLFLDAKRVLQDGRPASMKMTAWTCLYVSGSHLLYLIHVVERGIV